MKTFAQSKNQAQKTVSASLARPDLATPGPDHREHPVLHLQRAISNQALQRMAQTRAEERQAGLTGTASPRFGHDFSQIPLHPPVTGAIQTKLAINKPGDEYEQEADRVAAQVMRMPEPRLQRACVGGGASSTCQTEELAQAPVRLQTKHVESGDLRQAAVPPSVHEVLRSPGQSLDTEVRAFMEPRFSHDFSRVRVHSGTADEQSARDVSAHAYTVGHDIVFGAGQFAPRTPDGRRLIAHELAHVIQQTGGENRAALRLSTAGTSVVQRDAAIDLRKKDETSGFASLARTFWNDNKEKSLEAFGLFLMEKVNAQLVKNGVVPIHDPPSFGPTSGGAAGGFRHQTWTVDLDLASTAAHPLATKIADLSAGQVAEVAGVCYHEARHAEQVFLVARVVASEAKGKKDAKAIAAELGIPEFVATAAVNSTAPLPGKDSMAQIQQWRAFGESGKHHDYWEWNEIFRGFVVNVIAKFPTSKLDTVDKVIAAWTALTPTIADWRKASLPPLEAKIDKLMKAKTSDAVDRQVLRDGKKIRAGIQAVIKADKALSDEVTKFQARQAAANKKPITASQLEGIRLQFMLLWTHLTVVVLELEQTTNNAYRAYPVEADAYAAENSVMKTFLSKPKTVAPKP